MLHQNLTETKKKERKKERKEKKKKTVQNLLEISYH